MTEKIRKSHKRELTFGGLLLALATLAYIFGWTNLFTVQDVTVSGSPNKEITAQVLKIADIQKGEKLARVEPRNISARLALAGINWVEGVNVSRNWLSRRVDIKLKARVPIAFSATDNRFIDEAGVLFDSPVKVEQKLIEIDAPNDSARNATVKFLLGLADELSGELSKISTNQQSNSQTFILQVSSGIQISWGVDRDNALKVKIYRALLAQPENKKIKYMDLSDPTKPSVR